MFFNTTNQIGKYGELLAKEHFLKCGYEILEINWRNGNKEIDLIIRDKSYVVFVEVKTRNKKSLIQPELTTSLEQQKRILLAADYYIKKKRIDLDIRFDIITIVYSEETFNLKHIKHAFHPTID